MSFSSSGFCKLGFIVLVKSGSKEKGFKNGSKLY